MRSAFANTGKFEILTDSKYLTSDEYLKRGDIVIQEGSHTIIVLENGSKIKTSLSIVGTATALMTMNVRKGSSTSYAVIGTVSTRTKVEVLEVLSNKWYKIKWKNDIGYVSNATGKYFSYKEIEQNAPTALIGSRDYSPVFNATYYSNKYSDLKKAFGTNQTQLLKHFKEFGMKECRQASANFNPTIYRNKYTDLNKAFGNDWVQYYEHYLTYGIKEGRIAK